MLFSACAVGCFESRNVRHLNNDRGRAKSRFADARDDVSGGRPDRCMFMKDTKKYGTWRWGRGYRLR